MAPIAALGLSAPFCPAAVGQRPPRGARRLAGSAARSRKSGPLVPMNPALTVQRSIRIKEVKAVDDSNVEAPAEIIKGGPGDLKELTKDDFYSFLSSAPGLVVVDFYTDWCGPCKMIYPKLVDLDASLEGVQIVKFNCNKYNKDLGKELGIKVAPTFHLYKSGSKVAEMTGTKLDKLTALIEANK